jgi:hypothetical protein
LFGWLNVVRRLGDGERGCRGESMGWKREGGRIEG